MRLIAKIIVAVLANALGLWVAAVYIPGFGLPLALKEVLWAAVVLTALNFFIKPFLKLVLGPVIILTLGLGLVVVNAIILYVLDFFSKTLTIESIPALLYATLIIGIINFVFHLATKK